MSSTIVEITKNPRNSKHGGGHGHDLPHVDLPLPCLLDEQDREVPTIERWERDQVDDADEERHVREDPEERGPVPGRADRADLLADADDRRDVALVPWSAVEQQVEAPGPLPADRRHGRSDDRHPRVLRHVGDAAGDRGEEPEGLRPELDPEPHGLLIGTRLSTTGVTVRFTIWSPALDLHRDRLVRVLRDVGPYLGGVGATRSPTRVMTSPGRSPATAAARAGRVPAPPARPRSPDTRVRSVSPVGHEQRREDDGRHQEVRERTRQDDERSLPDGLRSVGLDHHRRGHVVLERVHPRDLHVPAGRDRFHAVLDLAATERPQFRAEPHEVLQDIGTRTCGPAGSDRTRGSG